MASQLKKDDEIKIFILYLLDRIDYPLDYPSIGEIMMQEGVVNFFDFAQCFFALVDAGHIREIVKEADSNELCENEEQLPEDDDDYEPTSTILYEVTDSGRRVARALSDSIMIAVREKSFRSAIRHISFAKQGAYVDHSYRREGDGYQFTCFIKDRKGVVMDMTVRADSDYQLDRMIHNFSDKPEIVYRGMLALLSGDVNYLFED